MRDLVELSNELRRKYGKGEEYTEAFRKEVAKELSEAEGVKCVVSTVDGKYVIEAKVDENHVIKAEVGISECSGKGLKMDRPVGLTFKMSSTKELFEYMPHSNVQIYGV